MGVLIMRANDNNYTISITLFEKSSLLKKIHIQERELCTVAKTSNTTYQKINHFRARKEVNQYHQEQVNSKSRLSPFRSVSSESLLGMPVLGDHR